MNLAKPWSVRLTEGLGILALRLGRGFVDLAKGALQHDTKAIGHAASHGLLHSGDKRARVFRIGVGYHLLDRLFPNGYAFALEGELDGDQARYTSTDETSRLRAEDLNLRAQSPFRLDVWCLDVRENLGSRNRLVDALVDKFGQLTAVESVCFAGKPAGTCHISANVLAATVDRWRN